MPYADESKNRALRAAYSKRVYLENRARLDALKAVPCADCGGTFPPECMDFDHVRGEKSFGIAVTINRAWHKLLPEIEKCEVVCANCHRTRSRKRKAAASEQEQATRLDN